MRRAAKIDANQPAIVEALRKAGASVLSLAKLGEGCPDLLVATAVPSRSSRTVLLEVKDGSKPPSARKLTDDERRFFATWVGEVYVVTSVEEALACVFDVPAQQPAEV